IIIAELGTSTTTIISSQPSQAKVHDKGKGILVEEPVKPKKKDLIRLDEEFASKLQAEFDEEERLAREKDEANVVLTEEWDDIQAKIEADHELSQRLQADEQEGLSVEEKAQLFQQLLEQRRKHFAAKRDKEKRNKPPTKAQQRKIMCTYLKNMEGNKPKDLKKKSFDSIQKMFDRAFKRVNTFVDFRTDLVESSSKRVGTELEQEIKELMEIDLDKEEVAIDAIPLDVKPPIIVDWKLKEFDLLKWDPTREDDHDVIHDNNSSDLALSASLNDLNFATLNTDGQSTYVEAPPYIIDVDEDEDFIDNEDSVPHDLAHSNDEVLANDDDDDDDDVVMSAAVARGHGGDCGDDDPSRPPPRLIGTGCQGVGGRNTTKGGREGGRQGTRKETRNIGLKKVMDEYGRLKIRF
ncbi:hypothetical protein Tco_1159885, partial [Tanacetum coccineum]